MCEEGIVNQLSATASRIRRRSHDDQRRTRGTRREYRFCSASSADSALNVVTCGGVRLSEPRVRVSGARRRTHRTPRALLDQRQQIDFRNTSSGRQETRGRTVGRETTGRQPRNAAGDCQPDDERAARCDDACRGKPRIHHSRRRCPLAALTGKHPGVCLAMESFVAEVVGAHVRECCDRTQRPQCCFEIRSRNQRPAT